MKAVRARFPSLAQPVSVLCILLLPATAGAQTAGYRQPGSAYTSLAMRGGPLPSASIAPDTRRSEPPAVRPAPAVPPRSPNLESRVSRLETNDRVQDRRLGTLEAGGSPRAVIAKKTSPEMPSNYVVRPGDTLSDIAVRHGLTTEALRAANGLSHDVLRIGQTLSLRPGRLPVPNGADAYVVQPGETFTDIALRYRVHPDDLARANPTVYPDRLLVGETLKIPAAKPGQATPAPVAETPAAPEPSKPGKAVAAVAVRTHVVAAGESLGAIAKRHGVATAALAAANGLKNPNLIVPGQRLIVPGAATPAGETPAVDPTPAPPAAEPPPVLVAKPEVVAPPPTLAVTLPAAAPAPASETAASPASLTESAPLEIAPVRVAAPRGIMAYLLEPGDDLPGLAVRFGTTVEQLRAMNKLTPDRQLGPGDEIIVPAAGAISLN